MADDRNPLAYPADLTAEERDVVTRLDNLITDAQERDRRQRRRMRIVLIASCIAAFVGLAIGIGSIFLNTALSDVRTVVHRTDELITGQAEIDAAQQCRATISGAYAALESRRDNLAIQAGLSRNDGDMAASAAYVSQLRDVVAAIGALPPRGVAYRHGVTIDGEVFKACT